MDLSLAAIALAIVLVVGLLAWTRLDLRRHGVPAGAWWLVVACYGLAGLGWALTLAASLPVALAWLATIPAALATVAPERVALAIGAVRRPARRTRPIDAARHLPRHEMAHRVRGTGQGVAARRVDQPRLMPHRPPVSTVRTATAPSRSTSPRSEHHRWHPGDLRLAVELLLDAAALPDLDDAALARIEARLGRLDRFREASTIELLDLVKQEVHGRLAEASDGPRAERIRVLLDDLDPPATGRSSTPD